MLPVGTGYLVHICPESLASFRGLFAFEPWDSAKDRTEEAMELVNLGFVEQANEDNTHYKGHDSHRNQSGKHRVVGESEVESTQQPKRHNANAGGERGHPSNADVGVDNRGNTIVSVATLDQIVGADAG